MPSREPVFKSNLSGEVSSFLDQKRKERGEGDDGDVEFLNIIDFIDRFKLLPFGLFPVQRFIVKLYYCVPLDGDTKTIVIRDKLDGHVLYEFTEVEYLRYLYDQKRCNIREQDMVERRELILVLGRRSGKSELSSIFAAYELYKLLRRGNPQSYYGLPNGSEIRVLCVANDKEQAGIVYGSMQGHLESVDYFKNSFANQTQTYLKFRTENDRKRFGDDGKATINATFKSSIAKGLRGRGIICAILDEIAFFVDDGKSSAEQVYRAIYPSLAQFSPKDKKNKHIPLGQTHGRMVLISSPDAREGFFYRRYQMAMSGDKAASNTLVIQAPTWEVNPTLDREYYEVEYYKDPKVFMTEHGGEFSNRVRGFIEEWQDLQECIVPDLRPKLRGLPRELHWAGVDFALSGDGTAVALTRINQGKVELAYHEVWYPKKRWRDVNPHLDAPLVPYALTLQDVTRLDIDELAAWIKALSTRFYIQKGIFDPWAGVVFEQVLHKKGLTQFEMRHFSPTESSNMFQLFKMSMYKKQLALYDWPLPELTTGDSTSVRHSPLIAELLDLQMSSAGKNIYIVEAPKVAGKHDDQSDALARSVLLAMEHAHDHPDALDPTRRPEGLARPSRGPTSYFQYHRARERLHGALSTRPGSSSMRRPDRR